MTEVEESIVNNAYARAVGTTHRLVLGVVYACVSVALLNLLAGLVGPALYAMEGLFLMLIASYLVSGCLISPVLTVDEYMDPVREHLTAYEQAALQILSQRDRTLRISLGTLAFVLFHSGAMIFVLGTRSALGQ